MADPTVHPGSERGMGKFLGDNWGYLLGLVLSLAAFIWILYLLGTVASLTPRETTLQAILLTVASVLGSWFISKLDAYFRRDEGVRRLGTQVARGIIVLTNEINVLVAWVERQKVASQTVDDSPADQSAGIALIHVEESLRTFRSMCMVALGGLSDVIGDPLRRYEEIQVQISRLQEEQSSVIKEKITQAATTGDIATLRHELDQVRRDYEARIDELARRSDFPAAVPQVPASPLRARPPVVPRLLKAGTILPSSDLLQAALKRRQSYLPPETTIALARLSEAIDEEMRREGIERTPKELRDRLEAHALSGKVFKKGHIAHSQIGRFFSLVFHGRLFSFSDGVKPGLLGQYENHITEENILGKYSISCLYRLWGDFHFGPESAPIVAEVLLGAQHPSSQTIAGQALVEMKRWEEAGAAPQSSG